MGDSTSATQINKLDFSDPFYLHANDASGTPITTVKLKGTENYNIWRRSMLLALSTNNKIRFIKGTVVRSETYDVVASQWDRCNSVVLSWILRSVTEDLYSGQIFSTNASNINTLKQNDSALSEYYHKLNTMWKQYDAMVSPPMCTCNIAACACAATTHKRTIKR
ncbi:uncharacterized protein [Rutidosis leptorrhynchoides]|uniref:uncharacterized protein n=1 Tax=Rutidosis leptorrhynchoides TaxID=125765 RepID=UPI003A99D447